MRALIHQNERPRRAVWEDLCELVLAWPSATHLREVALPYAQQHLDAWDDADRSAPASWRLLLREGQLPEPLMSLVRRLKLGKLREEQFDALLERGDLSDILTLQARGWGHDEEPLERFLASDAFEELEELTYARDKTRTSTEDARRVARTFGASTSFPNLHRLTLHGWKMMTSGARLLRVGGSLSRLGALGLIDADLSAQGIAELLEPGSWPSLTHLELRGNAVGNEGLAHIARWGGDGRLSHLGLQRSVIGADAAGLFAREPAFSGLISLDVTENTWLRPGIAQLARAPFIRNLISLRVGQGVLDDSSLERLLAGSNLAHLEHLSMPWSDVTDRAIHALTGSSMRSLRALDLNQNWQITHEGIERLANAPLAMSLDELRICGVKLGIAGTDSLVDGRFLTSLRRLAVAGCELGDDAATALFAAPSMAMLEALNLSKNELGDRALEALSRTMHLYNLTSLDLSRNRGITSDGIIALMNSPACANLTRLDLSETSVDDRALVAIAQSPYLVRLRSLSIRHTEVSIVGFRALASAPHLRFMEEVETYGLDLSDAHTRELRELSGEVTPWLDGLLGRIG